MSPMDYVAPVQVEAAAVQDDTAADELEWLQIAKEYWRIQGIQPNTSYDVPAADGHRWPKYPNRPGSAYWLGPKVTGPRIHPQGYRIKGESAGLPTRAKSPLQAELALAGTSTLYTPPQLGPSRIGYGKHLTYNYAKRDWR